MTSYFQKLKLEDCFCDSDDPNLLLFGLFVCVSLPVQSEKPYVLELHST